MSKFYFYNGFEKPEEVKIDELVVDSNYLGDVTEEFKEVYEAYKNESDNELNEQIGYYGVYRNPTVEIFQELNVNRFGLDKNEYLQDWI